ncbi:MAG: DMT family transporter [Alphaproteobacteria bacterium]|nr:DMT family transporter [Alphaproteobacteria bacterium]
MTAPPPADSVLRGILFMCLAATVMPAMNALAKHLGQDYSPFEVVWARVLGHLVFVLAVFAPQAGGVWALIRTRRPVEQFTRSTMQVISMACFFYGIPWIPLADGIAINFSSPFIVAALSLPLLGERVGPRRWIAIAIGFLGAMIIIRPVSSDGMHWLGALLMVVSAICYGIYQVLTRRVSADDSPGTTVVWTVLVPTVVFSLVVPFVWVTPSGGLTIGMFLAIGALGAIAHYWVARAYAAAPAAIVAPFNYGQLLGAAAIGFLAFGDVPGLWTWVGAAVIVASGMYIAHSEAALARAAR